MVDLKNFTEEERDDYYKKLLGQKENNDPNAAVTERLDALIAQNETIIGLLKNLPTKAMIITPVIIIIIGAIFYAIIKYLSTVGL